jgi:DNA-binding response OmpR family regulator
MKVLAVNSTNEEIRDISFILQIRWPQSSIISANDDSTCLEHIETELPDLVILDISKSGYSGVELISQIRSIYDVPLIIITDKENEMVRITALDKGADDYIIKPFAPMELLGRMVAVLRRCRAVGLKDERNTITVGNLTIDGSAHQVYVSGNPVKLTPLEYCLLYHLARNEGRVLTHSILLDKVWGSNYSDGTGFVKKYVHRLRLKLHDDAQKPSMIVCERGIGYKLVRLP